MKKTRILSLLMALVLLVGLLAACSDAKSDEKINATVILVDEDGAEVKYDLSFTAGATLREALFQSQLIDEENSVGFFVETIDGHTASAEEGVLWMVVDDNGDMVFGAFDELKPQADQTVRIVYTVAPNFDD